MTGFSTISVRPPAKRRPVPILAETRLTGCILECPQGGRPGEKAPAVEIIVNGHRNNPTRLRSIRRVPGQSVVWISWNRGREGQFKQFLPRLQQQPRFLRMGHRIVVVHDFEFRKLVENGRPARASDRISGQPVEWLKAPNVRQFENVAVLSGPLNRESTAHGRVEQGYLRRRLFGEADDGECYLCGRSLPTSLLIAAHIKPRSECSRRERLDADNVVFSLCLLGCDALYERGLAAVRPGGSICFSNAYGHPDLKRAWKYFQKPKCKAWTEARATYFDWHLRNRFQG